MVGTRFVEVSVVLHPRKNLVLESSDFVSLHSNVRLVLFTDSIVIEESDDLHIPCFPFIHTFRTGFWILLRKHDLELNFKLLNYPLRLCILPAVLQSQEVQENFSTVLTRPLN